MLYIRSRNEENMNTTDINTNYQKHMTLDDRVAIETNLNESKSFRAIGLAIGKDPTTISKEIKKHRIIKEHSPFNTSSNKCFYSKTCKKKNVCNSQSDICKKKLCKNCFRCNSNCPDFKLVSYHCSKLDKAPFVCNGCEKKIHCRLDKYYYRASLAHKDYKTVLVESRTGINITPEDLAELDALVTPLILNGHSPYMILNNHPEIQISEKTLYNYIESGALSVRNIDLPKKVTYKVRASHYTPAEDSAMYESRTYKDYQNYIIEYPDTKVVEMDTVIGQKESGKTLLTLHFGSCSLMMAYLMDSKEARHVKAVFDYIEQSIGTYEFSNTLPLILTDRGGEFRNPEALELGIDNVIRTSIYYCDPMCSWQKPHCEKNHEYIRKILPKGTSFNDLTQADVTLMMSHINSTPRQNLGDLSPMYLAKMMLPKSLLDCFGLKEIPYDEIILTPKLLKK